MPLIQCRSAPVPVASSAQATGVTDGKLETQSGTSTPRSSSAAKVDARPSATVRSSMSVRSEAAWGGGVAEVAERDQRPQGKQDEGREEDREREDDHPRHRDEEGEPPRAAAL